MVPPNVLADKRLVRHRDTRWFGSGFDAKFPKPTFGRTRIPIKSPSTSETTTEEGITAENVGTTERSAAQPPVVPQVQHGRLPSPVRPNVIPHGSPAVWTSKNADPLRAIPADPWKEYLPSLEIRQGSYAILAFKRSTKSPDGRAFAIMKTSTKEKESHLFKLSNIRNSSFLDIIEVFDWKNCLFTVAEFIFKSFLEIILNPIPPNEEQIACLADQVWPAKSTVIRV
jgi:hypothetical protein